MTTYRLGITSADAIQLYPEWNFKLGKKQIRNQHRARSASLFIYKWSDYHRISFNVDKVAAADAIIINSWWDTNQELVFFVDSGGGSDVRSVILTNNETPLNQFPKPYNNLYKGSILLEGY